MPKDCQKLYRQFIRLGKQAKIVKRDIKEFIQKKVGFVQWINENNFIIFF